ncbi:caspase family protein [Sphingomonas sp. 1P06PA]|uniref:caspase family protein n=1 Tax=Sphingomonas sp. 1P06PA TaxID=554121 RepID=UPI0039A78807
MSAPSRTASSSAPIKRRARLAALACAALAWAAPALADRALLIGTGDYPALAADLRLAAPAEDATQLRAALVRAGLPAANIAMMTDREGPSPTRTAVLAALDGLAGTARTGEQILVYFSGHGSQAPAQDPAAEPDGLDELYLMRDAAGWDGGQGRVPGAITDSELAAAIDRIRARGADVWLVADTCHAAGVYRSGLPAGVRPKSVPAAALNIPAARPASARSTSVARPEPGGGFAGFYAAAPGSLAIERRLPLGAPEAVTRSQFSFALVRALDSGRLRSLRDLAIALNAADDMLGGGAPQPSFEGALGRSVLGLAADRPRRFLAARDGDALMLSAGVEEGLAPGMRMRLTDAADGQPVGHATVASAMLGRAVLHTDGAVAAVMLEAEAIGPVTAGASGRNGLLAEVAPIAGSGVTRDLVVEARLWRPGPRRICPDLPDPVPADTRPIDLLTPPALRQCDVVLATVRNTGSAPIDISPFYVDAGGRLVALGFVEMGDVRLAPGERRGVAVRLLSEDRAGRALPTGSERLLFVALPAGRGSPVDLRGAADAALRAAAPDPAAVDGAGALVYRWTVVPARR